MPSAHDRGRLPRSRCRTAVRPLCAGDRDALRAACSSPGSRDLLASLRVPNGRRRGVPFSGCSRVRWKSVGASRRERSAPRESPGDHDRRRHFRSPLTRPCVPGSGRSFSRSPVVRPLLDRATAPLESGQHAYGLVPPARSHTHDPAVSAELTVAATRAPNAADPSSDTALRVAQVLSFSTQTQRSSRWPSGRPISSGPVLRARPLTSAANSRVAPRVALTAVRR